MAIDALPQIQHSYAPRSANNQPGSAGATGNMLPLGNNGKNVSISADGRSALERERRHITEARDNQEFVDFRGHEGRIRLGLLALGQSAIDEWSAKGLEIDEKSILAVGEAFQNAFRRSLEENGSSTAGSAIALNRHQIIIDSQMVPDWFVKEYGSTLSSMGEGKLKSAFANGDAYYVSSPSEARSGALNRYA